MQPLSCLASSLYCAEEADDVTSWDAADARPHSSSSPPHIPISDSSLREPHRPISDLFAAEVDHMPRSDYLARFHDRSLDSTARQDAVNWILKVHAFYRFRPVTAYLSVNYLDRFLSSNTLPGSGWPWQLLSVACLSVAAKMEETDVPLLIDFQILEPRFVFEPRTIQRMELLLMASLRWRMRSVTPFDFVDHFSGVLPSDRVGGDRYAPLFSRASDFILSTHRVVDFLGYRPSAIAAAAVLCAAGEVGCFSTGDGGDDFLCFYDMVNKEMVDACRQLMDEYVTDTCPSCGWLKGASAGSEPPVPQSPVGVLDAAACGSCDTQKTDPNTEPSRDEPPSKRRRLGSVECTDSVIGTSDDGKNLRRE